MRVAYCTLTLLLSTASHEVLAAPIAPDEVRRLIEPHLSVCMEIPIGPHRLGAADKELDARLTGMQNRGLVTITTIGQGDSLMSGDTDLERLEEQRPFTRLVDIALADGIERDALCTMTRHRVGVPLGTQVLEDISRVEPVGDDREAQVLVEGRIGRVLSRYALRFDPALTTKATFQAVLVYDNDAKIWTVRRFATQNVRQQTK